MNRSIWIHFLPYTMVVKLMGNKLIAVTRNPVEMVGIIPVAMLNSVIHQTYLRYFVRYDGILSYQWPMQSGDIVLQCAREHRGNSLENSQNLFFWRGIFTLSSCPATLEENSSDPKR